MPDGSPLARPIAVTHVVRQFHPAVGGFEEVVLNLARRQRRQWGIDARVVTLDRLFTDPATRLEPQAVVDEVPVSRIAWHGSSRYPLAPTVLSKLDQADIVHVHAIDFFFDFLALTRPLHRRCLVASTHGGFFHTGRLARLKQIWFRTMTPLSIQSYDAIIAVSDADALTFAPVAGRRLAQIENGVNLGKFPPRPGIARDPRRIVTFGRLTRHKQVDRLVRLLVALLRLEPGWTLAIAGPSGDHSIEAILKPAFDAGLDGSVQVLGTLPETCLADEIARASWFGSASTFEGFGLAAVEAAASGLIPVLSAIPTFTKLQAALGVGLLFDPDQPEAIAHAMTEQADRLPTEQPGLMRQLAARVAPYGLDAALAAHIDLYAEVLRRARRPAR